MGDQLITAVRIWLERIAVAQDPTLALRWDALRDADRLARKLHDDSNDLEARYTLGWFSWYQYLALPNGEDQDALEKAVGTLTPCFMAGVEEIPEPLRPLLAENAAGVAIGWLEQALSSGDLTIITNFISLWRRIVAALSVDHPHRVGCLFILGEALRVRFERAGVLADVDEAIRLGRDTVLSVPASHPGQAAFLSNLGAALQARFRRTGSPTDIDEAINASRRAVQAASADDPSRVGFLSNLGAALWVRFERVGGSPDLLDEAISIIHQALQAASADHPDRAGCLIQLGAALMVRFEQAGSLADLEEAISAGREAAQVMPRTHVNRAMTLSNLSSALQFRFERVGTMADLDEAISIGRETVQVTPADHPNRCMYLSNLSAALCVQFEQVGALADLDEAIDVSRETVQATPSEHPDRGVYLSNLGTALQLRFVRVGTMADLDEAISVFRQAVRITPAGHLKRVGYLSNLSATLQDRFEQVGAIADLNEAISAGREAVQACPVDHPNRAAMLSVQGAALYARFQRVGALPDLEETISVCRSAVQATPVDHPNRSRCLSYLGRALWSRFDRIGTRADLEEAIGMCRAAVHAAPADHPYRVMYLSNLGGTLRLSFERTGAQADLEESISVCRSAVQATPADHPDLARCLSNLGDALRTRFERAGKPADRDEASTAYARVTEEVVSGTPSMRIYAARMAALLTAQTHPQRAADLMETAVRLLAQTAPRRLDRADQQHVLEGFAGLAGDAAALALADEAGTPGAESASRALRLLELGRGVILSQTLDTRSDLTDLHARHPVLAKRFIELRDQLDQPGDGAARADTAGMATGWKERRIQDRHQLAAAFEATVNDIRGRHGFETFLLPPEPDQLLRYAQSGPVVVINVSQYRSDAILLTPEGITSIPLPDLAQNDLIDRVNVFHLALRTAHSPEFSPDQQRHAQHILSVTLEWLWDAVARPSLDALGYHRTPAPQTAWPRVWWVPGGPLSLLPLHAAGYHREQPEDDTGRRTVMDRVVSSYTPTVRALGYARERIAASAAGEGALVVAMPTTPGLDSPLPYVADEAELVHARLSGSTLLVEDPATPACSVPTKVTVLTHMSTCSVVHFACHGSSHPGDPSQSLLLLHDHDTAPLTVASLAPIRLEHARLAYLSACQTAFNHSIALLDEAIHLTTAFQLAGYPHVVGTLWEIDDALAVRIADAFYAALTTDGTIDTSGAAQALHDALRAIRDELPATPSLWAAYLHAGA